MRDKTKYSDLILLKNASDVCFVPCCLDCVLNYMFVDVDIAIW